MGGKKNKSKNSTTGTAGGGNPGLSESDRIHKKGKDPPEPDKLGFQAREGGLVTCLENLCHYDFQVA